MSATSSDRWNRQDVLTKMDLFKIVRSYIEKMLDAVPGYKALLVDKDSVRVLSTVFSQTELGMHEVFCTERIDAHEPSKHSELKAICFLRPTRENITHMKREIRSQRFQRYFVYFSNIVRDMFLADLADVDASVEAIQSIQEFYADYIVLEKHHFTIPVKDQAAFINPKFSLIDGQRAPSNEVENIERMVQGLASLMLSLRRRPVIRYQNGSDTAVRLAMSLYSLMYSEERSHFDFGLRGNESPPLLLILDRKDDPVTPLLSQWTYQAMVHELLSIQDNTVKLSNHSIPKDHREVVLAAHSDEFFEKHMYANYGDLGIAVKELVEGFKGNSAESNQVKTIEDMRHFLMNYGEFSQQQRNVSRHVNVVSALSEHVSKRSLMETSEVEQDLACATGISAANAQDAVIKVLQNRDADMMDKIRLVMLYALRFEGDRDRLWLVTYRLGLEGVDDEWIQCVHHLLRYAGKNRRRGDLYGTRSVFSYAKKMAKAFKGIENVYTQHSPLLSETLRLLANGDLSTQDYPYASDVESELAHWQTQYKRCAPQEVIVFIVGGTTYEEAKIVHELNERTDLSTRFILGGTDVLSSSLFIDALLKSSQSHGGSTTTGTFEIMKDIAL